MYIPVGGDALLVVIAITTSLTGPAPQQVAIIMYTWNFPRYVNFTDFAANRAAVKFYSVNILPSRIFTVGSCSV